MRVFLITLLISLTFSSTASSVELYVASSFERFAVSKNREGKTYADASSRLASQILAGAQPDVFVSANLFWAQSVHKENSGFSIQHIANNELVVVALMNSKASEVSNICELKIGAALEEVPAGAYADIGLKILGCDAQMRRAPNVGAVREWIESGHVDVGFLYASDLVGDSRLQTIHRFAPTKVAVSIYALPLTKAGEAWVNKVNSSPSLLDYGFKLPVVGGDELLSNMKRAPPKLNEIDVFSIMWNSALVGLFVVLLAIVPAILIGFLLARWRSRWKPIVSIITLTPLVVPPVVTGLLLLKLFGKHSVLSPVLNAIGSPAFTWVGAVIASLVVSFPLFIVMTRRAFESIDEKYEVVGLSCGLSRRQTFLRINLPLAMPGIVAGAMLTFARSIGEFGATAVFAGNLAADGGTLSLAIYRSLQSPTTSHFIWTLTAFSILLSIISILIYERFSEKQKALFSREG